jgi:hypothetical protein
VVVIARLTTRPPSRAPAVRRSVAVLAMNNLSREIGRNLGCDLILTGNYLWIGGRVRVDVRFDDVASGEPVASLTVTDDERNLVELVGRVNSEVRAKLGIEATSASQLETVRASLSSDPAALRAYFLGVEALRLHDGERARDLLTQSVTIDPDFALAHSALSITWRRATTRTRAGASPRALPSPTTSVNGRCTRTRSTMPPGPPRAEAADRRPSCSRDDPSDGS